MITPGTSRAALAIALAAALAAPIAAQARADGCPADNRLASSMSGTLGKSLSVTAEQLKLLLQMFSLQSAKQPVPPGVVDSLRSRTARNRRLLARGEQQLAALPPGTPQGRAFKRIGLRYLHEAVRPMNECIGDAVEAKTVAEIGAAVTCFDNGKRSSAALERSVNKSLNQLARVKRCTLGR